MVNQNNQNGFDSEFGMPNLDGLPFGKLSDVVGEFFKTGDNFLEVLVRSGMPFADAIDYATIWRKGIAFRNPELVMIAVSALVASMGADGGARKEALTAAIGRYHQEQAAQRKSVWSRLNDRGKKTADVSNLQE